MLPVIATRNSLFPATSLFDEVFHEFFRDLNVPSALSPALNLREDAAAIYVSVELPGVSKEDVDISLKDGVLTIKGEKKHEKADKKEGYTRMERSYGSFERSIRLPKNVDAEKVSANLKDGVLELSIPKTERDIKQITIN